MKVKGCSDVAYLLWYPANSVAARIVVAVAAAEKQLSRLAAGLVDWNKMSQKTEGASSSLAGSGIAV